MISRIRMVVDSSWLVLAAGILFLSGSLPRAAGAPKSGGTRSVAVAPQIILGANGEGKKAQELLQAGHAAEAQAAAEADLHTSVARSGFSSFGLLVPYNNLGAVYVAEGNYAQAHKMFSRAIGLGKAAVSQGEMGSGYSAGSTYTQAGAGAGKGVALQKKLLALCLFNNSIAYRKEGDLSKADRFQADARKLDPSLPELK
ncbi:MAG: hypothetical protein AB7T14_00780 [Candidatus Methylacidiphilaceae bacterium]